MSTKYLGYEPVHIEELIGKKGKAQISMRDVPIEKIKEYAVEDADITLQLKKVFVELLKKYEVEKVFSEVENPLVKVLTDMEYEGVTSIPKNWREKQKAVKRQSMPKPESVSIFLLLDN
jgi:DNA polymerase-1